MKASTKREIRQRKKRAPAFVMDGATTADYGSAVAVVKKNRSGGVASTAWATVLVVSPPTVGGPRRLDRPSP